MELFNKENNSEEYQKEESVYSAIFDLLEKLQNKSNKACGETWHALHYGYSEHKPVQPPLIAIQRFLQKVLKAEQRSPMEAEHICSDRLDPDTALVLNAAWKVMHEFDRLRGLLRFSPEPAPAKMPDSKPAAGGTGEWYIARCTPDHFVLPLFSDHFLKRFGTISWAIIDERRNYILYSEEGKKPVLQNMPVVEKKHHISDGWENLWKNYHSSINNESRFNPQLQKQFMPRRYWKYLPEAPSAE